MNTLKLTAIIMESPATVYNQPYCKLVEHQSIMTDPEINIDELIALCQEDEYSLVVDRLMTRFYAPLYQIIRSIIHDPDEAEDITQDTFITAINNLSRYHAHTNLKAWLFTIGVNKSKDALRKRKRQTENLNHWKVTIFDEIQSENPERETLEREISSKLWQAVQILGEKHRIPVILRYVHEMPIREISTVLEISEGTIHSRLHYACKKLRKIIQQDEQLSKLLLETTRK